MPGSSPKELLPVERPAGFLLETPLCPIRVLWLLRPVCPDETGGNMSIIQGPAQNVHFDDALFEGDSEFLAEIVGLFLSTCPELLSAVEDAVRRKDAPGLRRAAHVLKGSVSNFGAKAVVEKAQTLEMMGKNGDLSGVEEPLLALRRFMEELAPELDAALDKATHKDA